jgi:broad-specificity NMP kinase
VPLIVMSGAPGTGKSTIAALRSTDGIPFTAT